MRQNDAGKRERERERERERKKEREMDRESVINYVPKKLLRMVAWHTFL